MESPPSTMAETEGDSFGKPEAGDMGKTFAAYCDGSASMDGRTFVKLCRDCGMIDDRLPVAEAELLFSKVATTSRGRVEFAEFEQALRLLAQRRATDPAEVLGAVAATRGDFLPCRDVSPRRAAAGA